MTVSETPEERLSRARDFVAQHLDIYISSRGQQGHLVDMSFMGGRQFTPTLLLQTNGRKSGRPIIVPLIYGVVGGEWVVVGSKGGSPSHPGWYLNLQSQSEVAVQVAGQAFYATWREPQGEERQKIWDHISNVFPPYLEYQKAAAGRKIPLVMVSPVAERPLFDAGNG